MALFRRGQSSTMSVRASSWRSSAPSDCRTGLRSRDRCGRLIRINRRHLEIKNSTPCGPNVFSHEFAGIFSISSHESISNLNVLGLEEVALVSNLAA